MENTSWKSDPSIRQTEPHKHLLVEEISQSYQVHILPEDYWTLPVHTWKEKKLIVIHSELRRCRLSQSVYR
ncbi:hypothetical protein N665_1900s0001 [Sinapis alba]|nr:hypothetical protein N665_1900s0001 [Sinapis alba]